ncbi:hypothetical protein OG534_00725 [Streptomyces sp. NBC_01294]|nr:hypothetical protein OG534_00725 [Streptomyces sp. NBC_01294]
MGRRPDPASGRGPVGRGGSGWDGRWRIRWLGLRDMARADFRLDRHGALHLLEVNGLPGLPRDGATHQATVLAGLDPHDGMAAAIITSALNRSTPLAWPHAPVRAVRTGQLVEHGPRRTRSCTGQRSQRPRQFRSRIRQSDRSANAFVLPRRLPRNADLRVPG